MNSYAYAIEATGLTKRYGETRAVDSLDLVVPLGGVLGLLGPNGAGKTTIVRILATLLRPDAGSARVCGHDVVRAAATVRGLIGMTGQFASIDDDLSARENLLVQARLLGLRRAAAVRRAGELLEQFELEEAARRPIKTYSGGMRRRLDIATSLVVPPRLLFLDEPTTGLDPRSRNAVWDVVRALVAAGTTVLLTTQYLEEADQLADRIVVIDHGHIVADGSPGQLKRSIGAGVLEVEVVDPGSVGLAARVLGEALGCPIEVGAGDPILRAMITGDGDHGGPVSDALAQLAGAGVAIARFALGQPSLDEVFLALTGHRAEDSNHDRLTEGSVA
jgi:ABC-2 type transport system ATP-binding protein